MFCCDLKHALTLFRSPLLFFSFCFCCWSFSWKNDTGGGERAFSFLPPDLRKKKKKWKESFKKRKEKNGVSCSYVLRTTTCLFAIGNCAFPVARTLVFRSCGEHYFVSMYHYSAAAVAAVLVAVTLKYADRRVVFYVHCQAGVLFYGFLKQSYHTVLL